MFLVEGLVPSSWTVGRLSVPDTKTWVGGVLLQHVGERFVIPPGVTAGTDGSGGELAQDHRLRSCGFGFALMYNLRPIGFLIGALGGPAQTVPRAELMALITLCKKLVGAC